MKYRVDLHSYLSFVVEAKDEDEAYEIAEKERYSYSNVQTLASNAEIEQVFETDEED